MGRGSPNELVILAFFVLAVIQVVELRCVANQIRLARNGLIYQFREQKFERLSVNRRHGVALVAVVRLLWCDEDVAEAVGAGALLEEFGCAKLD